jgi:hydrogenase maturation protease
MRYLIGIGHVAGLDDGIGPRLVEYVREQGLEEGFRALDLGAASINITAYLDAETTAMLIVDAARMGLAPGDYRFFAPDDVESRKAPARFSAHEGDPLAVLALARSLKLPMPPVILMGIEPEAVRPEIGLSPVLAARMPEYAAAAVERLRKM